MSNTPEYPMVASARCLFGGLALILGGAATLLSAGLGEHLMRAATTFPSLPIPMQVIAATSFIFACVCASSVKYGTQALLWGFTFAFAVLMSFLAASSALGWALASGFSLGSGLVAFGSPGPGLGSLSILLGIVALVWCRTAPAAKGLAWGRKAETTAVTAAFLIMVPGMLAFVHGQIKSELAMAVETQVSGELPKSRSTARVRMAA